MSIYRVYFREASGIVGRHDFVAGDDQEAVSMADILCDACSDRCSSFEVWEGGHRILAPRTPRFRAGVEGIQERRQEAVIEHEDTILRSPSVSWSTSLNCVLSEEIARSTSQNCDRSNYDPGR